MIKQLHLALSIHDALFVSLVFDKLDATRCYFDEEFVTLLS